MSAFLGPIHYWMYDKIRFQEELTSDIAFLAADKGWMSADQAAAYTCEEQRPLEELIDEANIHGWLQGRIDEAESRYAALVTELLKEDGSRIEAVKEAARTFGAHHAVESDAAPEAAYRRFNDVLLSGMPCDRVIVITEQDAARWAFREEQDIHAQYWLDAEGDPEVGQALRSEIMRGMLDGCGLTLQQIDEREYAIA